MIAWSEYCQRKVLHPDSLEQSVKEIRKEGKTIATLNGSFDLMHAGHLHIIFEAAQVADILIVALNSDQSIKQYKGQQRPIVPLQYRIQLMAALEFVDFITWFDETDPRKILSVIKPDIHVNGAEYTEHCIEAPTVISNGGRLHLVPRIDGLSTSDILKKITDLQRLGA